MFAHYTIEKKKTEIEAKRKLSIGTYRHVGKSKHMNIPHHKEEFCLI